MFLSGCIHFQTGPSLALAESDRIVIPGRGQIHVIDLPALEGACDTDTGADAILLVHGYGSSIASYRPIISELQRHHRVIAIDLPGFGQSDRRAGDYSPEALADVLAKVINHKGVEKVHLVGHSWGGSIVLAFALKYPEKLAKLVVISGWVFEEQVLPFMRWADVPGLGETVYGMHYRQLAGEKLYLNFYDPSFVTAQVVDEVEKNLARPGTVAAALAAARGMHFAAREKRHKDIVVDTLLLWGAEDQVSRPVFGARLSRELPHARLITLPACGHIPMIECRGPTAAALVDFLDRAP